MSEAASSAPALDPTSAAALEALAAKAWPLQPPDGRPSRNDWLRDQAALLVDGLLVRVARGRGALDVALGEGLAALGAGDRTLRLGYQSVGDYALQRLGIAASTAEKMARLSRTLRERPLLRAAVWGGEVTARKAEAIVGVARGEAEAPWVERARRETVRALEEAVTAAGGTPAEEPWDRVAIAGEPEVLARWNEALALAGVELGQGAPPWKRVEAVCAEFLGEFPEPEEVPGVAADGTWTRRELTGGGVAWGPEPIAGFDRSRPRPLDEVKAWLEAEYRQWEFLERVAPVPAPGSESGGAGGPDARTDPFELDEELRRLAALRNRWDELLGHLALLMRMCGFWRDMMFGTFGHYCSERLGLGERTVSQRIALERRLYELPPLRAALRDGRVSYEQARLIAREATLETLEEWIVKAAGTTCVALSREVASNGGVQMCARGKLGLRLPASTAALLDAAFRAAQAAVGRPLTAEFCLWWMAEYFIQAWNWKNERRRRGAIERDGGWCQVPGCSRPAGHEHHIQFRSAGGGDEEENRTPICPPHHLHGIHMGWIRVTGQAPDGLRWELGVRDGKPPLEVWSRAGPLAGEPAPGVLGPTAPAAP